jgi:hypothetical protein
MLHGLLGRILDETTYIANATAHTYHVITNVTVFLCVFKYVYFKYNVKNECFVLTTVQPIDLPE